MDQNQDYQAMLLNHMRTFPPELPEALLEAAADGEFVLNGGDFILRREPIKNLFNAFIPHHGYREPQFLLLSTPTVCFAYDTKTGREIANTLEKYCVKDRTSLLPEWRRMLQLDSAHLRDKGLEGLASGQDKFIQGL